MAEEPKVTVRQRTFLKGTIYFDNRFSSVECVIRDISESGARLTFDHPAAVPDNLELFIPQRQQTLRARVQRWSPKEIDVAFEADCSLEPQRVAAETDAAADAELHRRVEMTETHIIALKREVAKLTVKALPNDFDAA